MMRIELNDTHMKNVYFPIKMTHFRLKISTIVSKCSPPKSGISRKQGGGHLLAPEVMNSGIFGFTSSKPQNTKIFGTFGAKCL